MISEVIYKNLVSINYRTANSRGEFAAVVTKYLRIAKVDKAIFSVSSNSRGITLQCLFQSASEGVHFFCLNEFSALAESLSKAKIDSFSLKPGVRAIEIEAFMNMVEGSPEDLVSSRSDNIEIKYKSSPAKNRGLPPPSKDPPVFQPSASGEPECLNPQSAGKATWPTAEALKLACDSARMYIKLQKPPALLIDEKVRPVFEWLNDLSKNEGTRLLLEYPQIGSDRDYVVETYILLKDFFADY